MVLSLTKCHYVVISINWRESAEKNDLSGTGIISSKSKKLPWFVHDKKYDWIPYQISL